MASAHIRDILTAFNPSLDFFAITTGDGRIKIWDTLKAQLQTKFADFTSTRDTNLFDTKGHLSVDYTCIKWLSFERKKKRKHSSSLLLLGTGSGEQSILNSSNVSGNWVEPKSGTMPKDASRRRVQASGQSAGQSTGHWFTGSDGRKVYVSKKNGQEMTGRSAYIHYRKESGTGFKKSKKKTSTKKANAKKRN